MKSITVFATLPTWGGRTTFSYRHDDGDLVLHYGNGRRYRVSAEHMERLRTACQGQCVPVFGPEPSLDAWTKALDIRTRIASYLAPTLVELGFAERSGDCIKFF